MSAQSRKERVGFAPPFVDSAWCRGEAEISTFAFDELLGTKLRALYQRKKGRDPFDLWHALDTNQAAPSVLIACFQRYMRESGKAVSPAQFEENLVGKRVLHDFLEDTEPLVRPGTTWDFDVAMDTVIERIIAELPGDPWKGPFE